MKRFTIPIRCRIRDNYNNTVHNIDNLLNDLAEENEQLKEKNKILKKQLEEDDLKNIKEANIKLFEENHKLQNIIKYLETKCDNFEKGDKK